jgi:ABC-type multidrug transport system permease subunit
MVNKNIYIFIFYEYLSDDINPAAYINNLFYSSQLNARAYETFSSTSFFYGFINVFLFLLDIFLKKNIRI